MTHDRETVFVCAGRKFSHTIFYLSRPLSIQYHASETRTKTICSLCDRSDRCLQIECIVSLRWPTRIYLICSIHFIVACRAWQNTIRNGFVDFYMFLSCNKHLKLLEKQRKKAENVTKHSDNGATMLQCAFSHFAHKTLQASLKCIACNLWRFVSLFLPVFCCCGDSC